MKTWIAAAVSSLAVSSLAAGAALAQGRPAGMPQDIADLLRDIGPVIEVQRTGAAYARLHPAEPYAGVRTYRELPYGAHERNVLDVFTAEDQPGGLPVLVFVHGGGFTGGDKRAGDSPFYDNVSRWAAMNGMVGVQINYRLAPDHAYPSGVEDLASVVEWLQRNAARFGGDAQSIVLFGHSAGASHVADYLAAEAQGEAPVAGAVLMSGGAYDISSGAAFRAVYYGDDASRYAALSSLPGLVATSVPLLVVDGELDTPEAIQQAGALTEGLAAAGRAAQHVRLPNHSHISEAYAIGTADVSLTDPLKAFVTDVTAGQ